MFVFTAKFSRKKLLSRLIPAVLLLVLAGLSLLRLSGSRKPVRLETNADRVAYLENLGWALRKEQLEVLEFQLPEELDAAQQRYAHQQEEQGFDFASCAGHLLQRYTYAVTNYPGHQDTQLNLCVCGGSPVGGEVCCPGEDGFLGPLAYPEQG